MSLNAAGCRFCYPWSIKCHVGVSRTPCTLTKSVYRSNLNTAFLACPVCTDNLCRIILAPERSTEYNDDIGVIILNALYNLSHDSTVRICRLCRTAVFTKLNCNDVGVVCLYICQEAVNIALELIFIIFRTSCRRCFKAAGSSAGNKLCHAFAVLLVHVVDKSVCIVFIH